MAACLQTLFLPSFLLLYVCSVSCVVAWRVAEALPGMQRHGCVASSVQSLFSFSLSLYSLPCLHYLLSVLMAVAWQWTVGVTGSFSWQPGRHFLKSRTSASPSAFFPSACAVWCVAASFPPLGLWPCCPWDNMGTGETRWWAGKSWDHVGSNLKT